MFIFYGVSFLLTHAGNTGVKHLPLRRQTAVETLPGSKVTKTALVFQTSNLLTLKPETPKPPNQKPSNP